MDNTKPKHGGARPGSGRKSKGEKKRVQMTATVQPLTRDSIKEYCRKKETRLGLLLDGMVKDGHFGPDNIIKDAIAEMHKGQDTIIRNAFQKHFGFPLEEVKDKENLEHIIVQGEPISSFRYRGETFLYWKDEMDFEQGNEGVTFTQQFKEV